MGFNYGAGVAVNVVEILCFSNGHPNGDTPNKRTCAHPISSA